MWRQNGMVKWQGCITGVCNSSAIIVVQLLSSDKGAFQQLQPQSCHIHTSHLLHLTCREKKENKTLWFDNKIKPRSIYELFFLIFHCRLPAASQSPDKLTCTSLPTQCKEMKLVLTLPIQSLVKEAFHFLNLCNCSHSNPHSQIAQKRIKQALRIIFIRFLIEST